MARGPVRLDHARRRRPAFMGERATWSVASTALFVAGLPFAVAMVATDDCSGFPIALAGLIPMAGLVCGAIGLARHGAGEGGACIVGLALNLILTPALLGFALLPLHGWLPW